MDDTIEKDEQAARDMIVSLAKDNHMYFVVWNGHFGTYFVALRNNSKLSPNIYRAIFESYYDLVGDKDEEMFRFEIQEDIFTWSELLLMVKAYVPRTITRNDIS